MTDRRSTARSAPDHAALDKSASGHEGPSEAQAQAAAAMFAMLADPTRLKLLWLLGDRELDVTTLAERARTTPTVASQHLAKLRLAGLVNARVEGRRRLYGATGTHLRVLMREALYRADHQVTGIPDHD